MDDKSPPFKALSSAAIVPPLASFTDPKSTVATSPIILTKLIPAPTSPPLQYVPTSFSIKCRTGCSARKATHHFSVALCHEIPRYRTCCSSNSSRCATFQGRHAKLTPVPPDIVLHNDFLTSIVRAIPHGTARGAAKGATYKPPPPANSTSRRGGGSTGCSTGPCG